MEIKLNLPPTQQPVSAAELKPLVESWRAGQIIKATVQSVVDDDTMVIRIGDKAIVADVKQSATPLSLQNYRPQQEIILRIVSAGQRPTLALTEPPPAPPAPNIDALRQALPKQQPLSPLLSNLQALSHWPEEKLAPQLRTIQALAQQFMNALPEQKSVQSADGLKNAINNSGPWLEHKLALTPKNAAPTGTDADLKANLGRLVQVLRQYAPAAANAPRTQGVGATAVPLADESTVFLAPTTPLRPTTASPLAPAEMETPDAILQRVLLEAPPLKGTAPQPQPRVPPQVDSQWPFERLVLTLLEQAEGALSRVRVNQLSHGGDDQPNVQTWTVELPLKDRQQVDVVALQITREGGKKAKPHEARWVVTLAFDFDETGPFHAKVMLDNKQVNVHMTAENSHTATRMTHGLPQLEQSLIRAGLAVQQLHVVNGPVPRGATSRIYQSLVDTHA